MDDLSTAFSDDGASYLSEGASVDSEDTNLVSNVTKKDHYGHGYGHDSPTDVRYPEENDMEGMLGGNGEPLPIVREGKVLTEEMYHMDSETAVNHINNMQRQIDSYAEYEQEEDQFAREMNTTKIAFSAYRNAVLHLVQHQHKTKSSGNTRKGEDSDSDHDSDEEEKNKSGSEPDANDRMKMIEQTAKTLVETKARACFDAVIVANEFAERREEKKSKGRNILFQELLTKGVDSPKKKKKNDKIQTSVASTPEFQLKESVVPNGTMDKTKAVQPKKAQEPQKAPNAATNTKPKPKPRASTQHTSQNKRTNTKPKPTEPQKFVRCKKTTRHPDCILSTLPKFQYEASLENDRRDDDEPTPARYRTTQWIGGMTQWRNQRRRYKEDSYRKCSCPDCRKDLDLLLKASASTSKK